jgi:predicted O-methyltransferase YrrM
MARWWSANLKNRSRFALRHPRYALRAIFRDLLALDERFLAGVTGSSPRAIREFLSEPFEDSEFVSHFRQAQESLRDVEAIGADCYAKRVLLQYAVVRAQKPDRILETGVANGVSSAYLLLALRRNERGELHSIDVGDGSFVPCGQSTGWIIPDWLRPRWTLHLGDARECLPGVLDRLGSVDIFIHDSLHTYEHMKFEYRAAYPHLHPGGILVSDDALWNPAFEEFSREVRAPASRILRGVGFLKKQE